MSRYATSSNKALTLARKINRRKAPGAVVTSSVPVVRKASRTATVKNLAGGAAFQMSDKMELVTTSFCGLLRNGKNRNERMYETEADRQGRITKLIPLAGAEFTAKLALTLRIQHGLRSISHWLAANVAVQGRGEPWLASFFRQVCVRADDPSEIVAAYWQITGKKGHITNAMKKGFGAYFSTLDEYRLAKYAGGQKSPSLVDLFNLIHPKPTNKNRAAFKQLMAGTLKNTETWEAKLSAAGQSKGEVSKLEVWTEMVNEGKMGQLGLLRNLRNIAGVCGTTTTRAGDAMVREACRQLTNEQSIRKSGILPFQYLTAYEVMNSIGQYRDLFKAAIDDAVEIAAGNTPSLGDRVLIAIDESGSMEPFERENAALFAAALIKSNPHAEIMFFATTARYQTFNRKLPILELQKAIRNAMGSGATNFNAVFTLADKAYDSIVILSDQEGWMGVGPHAVHHPSSSGAPVASRAAYEKKYKCKPVIFSFDLGGDGSLMFREDSIILLAGFSFAVFKLLHVLKNDRVKLTDTIDKIVIGQPLPPLGEIEED